MMVLILALACGFAVMSSSYPRYVSIIPSYKRILHSQVVDGRGIFDSLQFISSVYM